MAGSQLIANVLRQMAQLNTTQSELAVACDLSQPHISKVLSRRVILAQKTERKLSAWLEATSAGAAVSPSDIVGSLAARLEQLRPRKRMQIMELLRAVERLIET